MKRIALGIALAAATLVGAVAPLKVGDKAPEFTAVDENGEQHSLAQYQGRAVVLEWTNSECPFVERHYESGAMKKLAAALGAKDVVWLAVNSTYTNTPDDTKAWKKEQGFSYATIQDPDGNIGHMYGARTTPHMFVIDGTGKVVYDGAIDDKRSTDIEDVKGARNYVVAALEDLKAGRPVATASTTPYGCSVKYR